MEEGSTLADKSFCRQCVDARELGFDFTMAFQPIVNLKLREVFGYEALVRGLIPIPLSNCPLRIHPAGFGQGVGVQ